MRCSFYVLFWEGEVPSCFFFAIKKGFFLIITENVV